jgi:hypothetical protein
MSAALALKMARAVGIRMTIDGDDLELEAPAPPPPAVLDLLLLHKTDILSLLRPANDGWSAEDWQVFFDERAAIAEFDGGLPRAEAEARVFACCVTEWLNSNPTPSMPGRCQACGGGERPCDRYYPSGQTQSAMPGCIARAGRRGVGREKPRLSRHLLRLAFQLEELMNSKDQRASQEEGEMSETEETMRPKPSDYGIDGSDPEFDQALADLVEMGLVVDSGQRRFQNGKWRIVWAAVPPEERGKQRIVRRKN